MVRSGSSIELILVLSLFLAISAYLNFRTENIFDPDSFYHIRHAWLYQTQGIFDSSFPWTQFSAIRERGADLWYGFHIFLMPFTYVDDLAAGIKVAGFTITFLVLSSLYFAFRNLKIKFSFYWPLLFLFSSGETIWRTVMTRPHPLSLGLLALIFSFFYTSTTWAVVIFSFLFSWIHASVFWLPIVILAPIVLFRWLNNEKISTPPIYGLLGGLAAGLAARPNPLGNIKLVYTQVVELLLAKNYGLAETIGMELRPPAIAGLEDKILFLLIIFSASIGYLGWLVYKKETFKTEEKILFVSSLVAVVFSILMYVTARRAIDLLALFTVILAALMANHAIRHPGISRLRILAMMSLIIVSATAYSLVGVDKYYKEYTLLPSKFKEPSTWLKENTKEGDIVFHLYWDQFPSLFYWNQHNYYIHGMDPVFLFSHDPDLYWKMYYMSVRDMGGLTCGVEVCGPQDIKTVYEVIKNDFKASYVFVRKISEKRFIEHLESDKEHFEKVYELGHSTIYKVLEEKKSPVKARK